jgi:myosin-crossreactive antigen
MLYIQILKEIILRKRVVDCTGQEIAEEMLVSLRCSRK